MYINVHYDVHIVKIFMAKAADNLDKKRQLFGSELIRFLGGFFQCLG